MGSTSNTPGRNRGLHSRWTLAVVAVLGVSLFIAFLALGTWQVQRRAWKLDLIERTTQRITAAPQEAPPPEQWPHVNRATHEYRAVRMLGHWLGHKTVLSQATTTLGAGFWVMTPLQLSGATPMQVMVNRGFIPAEQRAQWLAPGGGVDDSTPVTVEGLLRISEPGGGFMRTNSAEEQRWHSRDVAAMAQSLALPSAAPYFVDAGFPDLHAATNTEQRVDLSKGPWPRPGLTVVRFTNTHLVYALTWYGLALMVLLGAFFVARYELKLRALPGNPPPPP